MAKLGDSMGDVAKEKKEMRTLYKKRRMDFVKTVAMQGETLDFLPSFKAYVAPRLRPSDIIALYSPMGYEADPASIFSWMLDQGLGVAFPKIMDNELDFVRVDASTGFSLSSYGFQESDSEESVDPDVIIAPLLAFDKHGYRLGYGKGHYDRVLKNLRGRKKVCAIGLAFPCQETASVPFDGYDEKLDAVLLFDDYIDFKKTK